jgi:hypothetical protein
VRGRRGAVPGHQAHASRPPPNRIAIGRGTQRPTHADQNQQSGTGWRGRPAGSQPQRRSPPLCDSNNALSGGPIEQKRGSNATAPLGVGRLESRRPDRAALAFLASRASRLDRLLPRKARKARIHRRLLLSSHRLFYARVDRRRLDHESQPHGTIPKPRIRSSVAGWHGECLATDAVARCHRRGGVQRRRSDCLRPLACARRRATAAVQAQSRLRPVVSSAVWPGRSSGCLTVVAAG